MQSGAATSTLCLRRSTSNPRHCVRPWRTVCTSSKGVSILKNFGRSKMRSRRLKVSASSNVGLLTTPGSWASTYLRICCESRFVSSIVLNFDIITSFQVKNLLLSASVSQVDSRHVGSDERGQITRLPHACDYQRGWKHYHAKS